MSDAKDAVRSAQVQNQKLAASTLVRKESLAAELATLERQSQEAASLATSGDPKVAEEAAGILRAVNERLTAVRSELAEADQILSQAVQEIAALEKLAGRAVVAEAAAIASSALSPDPVLRSPEQTALDHARDHIGNLDAQARLGPEPAAPKAHRAPLSEAEARAELEAMRAKTTPEKATPEKKPKKTL